MKFFIPSILILFSCGIRTHSSSMNAGEISDNTLSGFNRVELLSGDKEACSSILQSVENKTNVRLQGFPSEFEAGNRLGFNAMVEKSFLISENDWTKDYTSIWMRLRTDIPYRALIDFQSDELKEFFFSDAQTRTFDLSQIIPPNYGGDFDLHMHFTVFDKRIGRFCVIQADFGYNVNVHSEHPDMIPPLVRGITFDKEAYSVGEEITVKLHMSKSLDKPETNHIEFVNPDVPYGDLTRGFPGYLDGSYHFLVTADGDYLVKFSVPQKTKSGNYYLEFFNRKDAVGNFEDHVGVVDQEEKSVVQKNPLIVK